MLTNSNHLKSISVYRSEIGEDFKVSIELLNGTSWCGPFPPSYDEIDILQNLEQQIYTMQHLPTPAIPAVDIENSND